MKDFAVFWGCTIPARFPFIEKATRLVMGDLGANVRELPGHTCCPEGVLVKSNDEQAFYTTAARNLALIEREGLDVVTPPGIRRVPPEAISPRMKSSRNTGTSMQKWVGG